MANFGEASKAVASQLLNSFTYVTDRELRQAIAAAIKSLSADVLLQGPRDSSVESHWGERLARTFFSVPLASAEDITSSGVTCLRILKEMRFPESRLLVGEPLTSAITTAAEPFELVLVDDLTATGTQFVRFWHSKVILPGPFETTLADLLQSGAIASATYIPVVATTVAEAYVAAEAPGVRVRPANTLGPEYFASHDECQLVPEGQLPALRDLIETNSDRTGNPLDPYGYGKLGLAISFQHGTPNNTLPILGPRPSGFTASNWTYLRSN